MKRALAAGVLVVVTIVVGATVWSVASTIADGATVVRSYDARCSQPSNMVFPSGSCAPPLRGEDFAVHRATLALTLTKTDGGTRLIDYTYENRTSKLRSFDWALVELTTPTGSRVSCAGDDTMQRYPAPPSASTPSSYPCAAVADRAVHRLVRRRPGCAPRCAE